MYLISTAIMVHNKGNFEKVPGHNFFKFSLNIHTSIWFLYLKFYVNHLFVVYAMRIINQQCRINEVYIAYLNQVNAGAAYEFVEH